jgi:hypothetical protein
VKINLPAKFNKKAGIDPMDIRIALLRAGVSGAQVARYYNVSRQYVNMALAGKRPAFLSRIAKDLTEIIRRYKSRR